jgi:hypothetical protein
MPRWHLSGTLVTNDCPKWVVLRVGAEPQRHVQPCLARRPRGVTSDLSTERPRKPRVTSNAPVYLSLGKGEQGSIED